MRFSVWARTPPDPFADPLWESPRLPSHPRPHRTGRPLRSAASASFTYRLVVARAVFLFPSFSHLEQSSRLERQRQDADRHRSPPDKGENQNDAKDRVEKGQ